MSAARSGLSNVFGNKGAERALLGWLLETRGAEMDRITVTREHFSDTCHRDVFDVMMAMAPGTIELFAVEAGLRARGSAASATLLADLVVDAAGTPGVCEDEMRLAHARGRLDSILATRLATLRDPSLRSIDEQIVQLQADLANVGTANGARREPLFQRAADIAAPSPTYLVDGLIADGMLHLLAGKDKRGKTLLGEEIGRCVVHGVPLFGQFAVRPGLVMAALLDDPLSVTIDRLTSLGLRAADDEFFIVDPTAFRDPRTFLDHLEAEALERKPALIIIDALYIFTPESKDAGNDAARMAPVMRRFDRLATATGAAVLLICHDNKSGSDVAGSFAVRAVAKVILRLGLPKGEEDEPDAGITSRRVLTLESKLVESTTWALELRGVGDWLFLGSPSAARAQDTRTKVYDYLRRSGAQGTAEDIAKAVKCRRADVEVVLTDLFMAKQIDRTSQHSGRRGRPAKVYFCPESPTGESMRPENPNGQHREDAHQSTLQGFPSASPDPRESEPGRKIPDKDPVAVVREIFPGARVVED